MRFIAAAAVLLYIASAGADPILLQDNYLGKPGTAGWTLPYDGVAAETSERNTAVISSWTGDDLVVPAGQQYHVSRIDWIGLLQNGPGAEWLYADVTIYPRNPDTEGHPIAPGTAPIAEFTNLTMDRFQQRFAGGTPEQVYGLDVYDGQVSFAPVTLTPGEYYYAVRVVGNGRGRHYVATTGNGVDFGAGHMGITKSDMFFTHDWTDISSVLYVPVDPADPGGPQMAWATDFSYRVWGGVTPEPGGLLLVLLGGLVLLPRR